MDTKYSEHWNQLLRIAVFIFKNNVIIDEQIRYPQQGDTFFSESGNPEDLAWLNSIFQKFGSYADGYKEATLALLDHAIGEPQNRDILIYPIVFLTRHFIELRLKELVQGTNYCSKQTQEFPTNHNLIHAWQVFKANYQTIGENIRTDEFQSMDALISEFSTIDPRSMAFRYPVDKTGTVLPKMETINIAHFRETFVRVSIMLDGISMQIAHYVDITEEMVGDMYNRINN